MKTQDLAKIKNLCNILGIAIKSNSNWKPIVLLLHISKLRIKAILTFQLILLICTNLLLIQN